MRLLDVLFSLMLIGNATLLSTAPTLADPGENNGNHFGQIQNGNNGNAFGQILNGNSGRGGSVPIPETLALFGAGLAGLVGWQLISRRKSS